MPFAGIPTRFLCTQEKLDPEAWAVWLEWIVKMAKWVLGSAGAEVWDDWGHAHIARQPIPHVDSARGASASVISPETEASATLNLQPPRVRFGEPYITWVRAGQTPVVPPGYTTYPMGTYGGAFILPDV